MRKIITVLAAAGAVAAVPATAHAATSVQESFRFTSSGPDVQFSAIALGNAFFGTGAMVQTNASDDMPQFRVTLNGGSFAVSAFGGQGSAKTTGCRETFTETDISYTIYQGTGRLAGLHGAGSATLTAVAVFPKARNGSCEFAKAPVSASETILASGPVSL